MFNTNIDKCIRWKTFARTKDDKENYLEGAGVDGRVAVIDEYHIHTSPYHQDSFKLILREKTSRVSDTSKRAPSATIRIQLQKSADL
jgi:hypothetical protein